MSQSRKDKIATIIGSRAPFAHDIETRKVSLEQTLQAILSLEDLCQEIVNDGPPTMQENLKKIDLPTLGKEIQQEIEKLRKPIRRFRRETLNIGVLGFTGHGKSTLLLNLSKLPQTVIPTGRGSYVTGARSLIVHDVDKNKEGAVVSFYSQHEFIHEVLAPYYQTLHLQINAPNNLATFERHSLPEDLDSVLATNGNSPDGLNNGNAGMRQGHVTMGEMYRHLRDYQDHLSDYRQWIGHADELVQIPEVRRFVAQEDIHGHQMFEHLAVKEAVITCNFGDLDVERVGLLDMPGLGDMRIADEEHLVKALEEEIDIILFIIKPDPDRGVLSKISFSLYDVAFDALEGIDLKDSSFIVFNHKKSTEAKNDNGDNCDRLKQEIKDKKRGVRNRKIEVHDCLIADCNDLREAREYVLDPILDYLVDHMSQIDKTYMDFWDARIADVRTKIEITLSNIAHLSDLDSSLSDEEEIFQGHFRKTWDNLTSALEKLLKELKLKSLDTNNAFSSYFLEKFELCKKETGLPANPEEVEQIRHREGDYPTAFNRTLHHVRTDLMHHFSDMDDRLNETMDEVKEQVAAIFMQDGKLVNLLVGISPSEFLNKLTAPEIMMPSHLQKTLRIFTANQLSFRGYFQGIMRNYGYLDNLVPDKLAPNGLPVQILVARIESLRPQWDNIDRYIINALKNTIITFTASTHPVGALVVMMANFLQTYEGLNMPQKEKLQRDIRELILDERQTGFADPRPDEMLKIMAEHHKRTVAILEDQMKRYYTEPGKATLAAVEEFTDQALRSRYARDEWYNFYHNYREVIWRSEFSQSQKWQDYRQRWQKQVDIVLAATRKL